MHEQRQVRQTRNLVPLLLFTILLAGIGCNHSDQNYCERLTSKLQREPQTRAVLLSWVQDNVERRVLNRQDVIFGGGMVPGAYRLDRQFDWKLLDFREDAQIRIIGDDYARPTSIFFGERSRAGIIVRLRSSSNFGVPNDAVVDLGDRVGIYCATRD
jgi:hypothetical protein